MKLNALILIEDISERARQLLILSIKLHTCVIIGDGWRVKFDCLQAVSTYWSLISQMLKCGVFFGTEIQWKVCSGKPTIIWCIELNSEHKQG